MMRFVVVLMLIFSDLGNICAQQFEDSDIIEVRVVFYNFENLFDTINDSTTMDDEFTPVGMRHWIEYRLNRKINNLCKTLAAVGEWSSPAVIGFCEVENREVLSRLFYETPLKKYNYQIIHKDSPDKRGIDVGLVYRQDLIDTIGIKFCKVDFPFMEDYKTRDILYSKLLIGSHDTIHLFVNHWTSRYGGYMNTRPIRKHQALLVRQMIDSIFQLNPKSNIVIMGDFNDSPEEESLKLLCNPDKGTRLINTHGAEANLNFPGTIKTREQWETFDQIIISENLYQMSKLLKAGSCTGKIFDAPFLFTTDERYLGKKLFRTYHGYKYLGGFSDHLPVYIDIYL